MTDNLIGTSGHLDWAWAALQCAAYALLTEVGTSPRIDANVLAHLPHSEAFAFYSQTQNNPHLVKTVVSLCR